MGVEEPRLIRLDSDEPEEHVLLEGETRIGRSRANGICLRASTVSRFHCYLVRKGDEVRVFDGKSKNPARLNGEPVSGQRLRTGQVLVVGKAEFVYQGRVIEEAPVAAVPPPRAVALAAPARTRPEPDVPRPVLPARRGPAGVVRRRRRERAGSREPALIAALVLLLAVPGVVWLVIAGMRSSRESAARIAATDPTAADLASRLRAQIAEIERIRAEERERSTENSARKIEELTAQLLEIHAELERVRAQPAAPTDRKPRDAPETPPRERAPEPPGKLYGTFSIPEELPREPTTVVIPQKPPLVRRRLAELREIQKRLQRNLEDYGSHVITPAVLAPDLEKLWLTEGKEGAAALLDLEKSARGLLRETDESIELNRKRKETLLAQARASSGDGPAPSDPKPYPKYAPATGGREKDQRLLDVCEKAMEIHRGHRRYLEPLRKTILDAIARVSAPEGLDALRVRLAIDDDEDLGLAIAGSFEGARWHESIPVLVQRLSLARSDRLRGGLRKALTALVGEDLGDRSAPWLEWWKARP